MAMGIKGKFAFVRGDGALIGVVREWRGRGFLPPREPCTAASLRNLIAQSTPWEHGSPKKQKP